MFTSYKDLPKRATDPSGEGMLIHPFGHRHGLSSLDGLKAGNPLAYLVLTQFPGAFAASGYGLAALLNWGANTCRVDLYPLSQNPAYIERAVGYLAEMVKKIYTYTKLYALLMKAVADLPRIPVDRMAFIESYSAMIVSDSSGVYPHPDLIKRYPKLKGLSVQYRVGVPAIVVRRSTYWAISMQLLREYGLAIHFTYHTLSSLANLHLAHALCPIWTGEDVLFSQGALEAYTSGYDPLNPSALDPDTKQIGWLVEHGFGLRVPMRLAIKPVSQVTLPGGVTLKITWRPGGFAFCGQAVLPEQAPVVSLDVNAAAIATDSDDVVMRSIGTITLNPPLASPPSELIAKVLGALTKPLEADHLPFDLRPFGITTLVAKTLKEHGRIRAEDRRKLLDAAARHIRAKCTRRVLVLRRDIPMKAARPRPPVVWKKILGHYAIL